MAFVQEIRVVNSMPAITADGIHVNLTQNQTTKKTFYSIKEMTGRISTMQLFKTMSIVCTSGTDNLVLGTLLDLSNSSNEIKILNITNFAKTIGVGLTSLKALLKRAVEQDLFHKLATGHYFVNPYIIMSDALVASGYAAQEASQLRWRKVTGLLTDVQLNQLVSLCEFTSLALRATDFNLSVAAYFAKHGVVTDSQLKVLAKEYS